jgi:heme A synthase
VPGYRIEDLLFGTLLALIALVSVLIALHSARRRDGEAVRMSGGLAVMLALCSLVLCTGWINILPLPK